jgi:hypothetical protein
MTKAYPQAIQPNKAIERVLMVAISFVNEEEKRGTLSVEPQYQQQWRMEGNWKGVKTSVVVIVALARSLL